MSIIYPKRRIVVPRHIIKEEIDRQHRVEWDDADRYPKAKQKALLYITARAHTIPEFSWRRLVGETARVFHDDLARDPEIKTAAQIACWEARQQFNQQGADIEMPRAPDVPAVADPQRGPVRGVDDSDETLASLEQQLHDELNA